MGSTSSKKLPQFVLFGDSLTAWSFDEHTEGFGWHLTNMYAGKVSMVEEGYPGYTSQHIKHEFETLIHRITRADAPRTLLITIFLGANDAAFVGKSEYVPLPKFEANIREFVETILTQDNLADARIVLITPPPINIPDAVDYDEESAADSPAMRRATAEALKDSLAYKSYMSKKRYADKIMQIASEHEETDRIVGFNFWKALVDVALEEQGRKDEAGAYDEEKLPGCGLLGAKAFRKGYFTDGLHLDKLGYNVLSRGLSGIMLEKWPELAPGRIES